MMTKGKRSDSDLEGRALNVDEIRLIADLRIMHSKVGELYQVVTNLKLPDDVNLTVDVDPLSLL